MALLDIIIFLAIVQIIVLVVLIIATFLVKWRLEYMLPIKQKRKASFRQALSVYPNIPQNTLDELKKHLHMTFVVFLELEQSLSNKKLIIEDLFLPQTLDRSQARLWYDRYMAAVMIQYIHMEKIDFDSQAILIALLHDPVALVSIHAFKAITIRPNEVLFNEAIEVFSKFRRSQLELMVSVIKDAHLEFVDLVFKRLEKEQEPYIRAFCYRLLVNLPLVSTKMPYLSDDLINESLNLSLASISYIFYAKKPLYKKQLLNLLQEDKRWQVRARCLKYLGRTQDSNIVEAIYPFLKDKVWWVRFRAAEACSHLGKKGEQALKKAKAGLDQFAKDMATQRLEQTQIPKEERL